MLRWRSWYAADWTVCVRPEAGKAKNISRTPRLDRNALLSSVGDGAVPVVRLYAWRCPTLSLGAHQSARDVDLEACRRLGVDVVRRPTGGRAVLHDAEVTYSVAGRLGERPFGSSVTGIYDRVAEALVAGLAILSVPAETACRTMPDGVVRSFATGSVPPADCFARPSRREILVGGRKLVGSAQLRRRGAFLQHGSILLGFDVERMRSVLSPEAGGSASSPPMTLGEWSSGKITRDEVEQAVIAGFERALDARLAPVAGLEPAEAEHAALLRAFKYLDAQWTLEGRVR